MLLERKKHSFSDTDIFPPTDTFIELDESTSAHGVELDGERRQSSTLRPLPRRTNTQKWLIACSLVTLYLLAVGAFHNLSMVQRSTVLILLGMIGLVLLLFFIVFQCKLHLLFKEKRLKLPIVTSAFIGMLVMCYLDPATEILFTPFAFVAIAYGMYRISRKSAMILVVFALLTFIAITGAHYYQGRNPALLKLELMHLVALATSLPAFVFLTGKVQHLHRVLHRASRKIRSIEEDAQRDTLIGCYNRKYTVAALEVQKQLADENNTPLCLAVIDLDHFKKINDALGHLGGDDVLRTFSSIAQKNVRDDDIFGRYGGEEFLLIFPNTFLLPALNTSERIRAQVEHYTWDRALKCRVSVSIGVTQYVPGESVLELFSRADTAMYLAKEGGRNQVVVEEPVQGKK